MIDLISKKNKITVNKFLELLELFSLDINVSEASELTNISRNTVTRYFAKFQKLVINEILESTNDANYIGMAVVRTNGGINTLGIYRSGEGNLSVAKVKQDIDKKVYIESYISNNLSVELDSRLASDYKYSLIRFLRVRVKDRRGIKKGKELAFFCETLYRWNY